VLNQRAANWRETCQAKPEASFMTKGIDRLKQLLEEFY